MPGHVCSKLIINSLPWTNAEYEQLIGRLYREGRRFENVGVIIPATFALVTQPPRNVQVASLVVLPPS